MFQIDQQSRVPLYEQLVRQVLSLAASGILEEDQQMPSVRQLAADLGINPNTVQKAYRELERDGLIYSVPGRGSFLTSTDIHVKRFEEEIYERMSVSIEAAFRSGFTPEEIESIFRRALETEIEKRQQSDQAKKAALADKPAQTDETDQLIDGE